MQLMTTDEVAQYLGLAPSTLNTWRSRGRGPQFIKVGKLVRYSRSEVDYWLGNVSRSPRLTPTEQD